MPVPTIRGATPNNSSTSTTSCNVNKPTGLANGDIMYVVVANGGAGVAPTSVPSGWTLVNGTPIDATFWAGLYRKIVTDASTEPASYTFSGFVDSCSINLIAVAGGNTTTPEHAVTARINDTGMQIFGTAIPIPEPMRVLFAIAEDDNLNPTNPIWDHGGGGTVATLLNSGSSGGADSLVASATHEFTGAANPTDPNVTIGGSRDTVFYNVALANPVLALSGTGTITGATRISDNLLTVAQIGFENDLGGWTADAGVTLSRSTVQPREGAYALAATLGVTGVFPAFYGPRVPAVAGQSYSRFASFRFVGAGNINVRFYMQFRDASDALISESAVANTTATSWVDKTATVTAPTGTAFVNFKFDTSDADSPGAVIYVDRLGLFPGTTTTWMSPATGVAGPAVEEHAGTGTVTVVGALGAVGTKAAYGADSTNLVANPGFESTSMVNWSTLGATIARDTTKAAAGVASGKLTATGATTSDFGARYITSLNQPVGTQLNVRVSVWCDLSKVDIVRLFYRDSPGGVTYATKDIAFTPSAGWTQVTDAHTVPAGRTLTDLYVLFRDSAAGIVAGDLGWIDEVSVTRSGATITTAGDLTAAGGAVQTDTGTGAVGGVAALTSSGVKDGTGTGALSGVVAAVGAGAEDAAGTSTIIAAGALTGQGAGGGQGTGAVAATTDLAATGAAAHIGVGAITATTGVDSTAASTDREGTGTVTAVATLTSAGVAAAAGQGTVEIAETTAITGQGAKDTGGTGAITTTGDLTGGGDGGPSTGEGTGTASASTALTGTGTKDAAGASTLTETEALTSTGVKDGEGTAAITAATGLTSAGGAQPHLSGAGAIAAVATLTSTGLADRPGTGSITGTTDLTGDGAKTGRGTALITAATTISSTGVADRQGTGALAATTALTGDGVKGGEGTALIDAVASLASGGTKHIDDQVVITALTDLTGEGARGILPNVQNPAIDVAENRSAIDVVENRSVVDVAQYA